MIGYISLNLKISSIDWNDTRLKFHGVRLLNKPSDLQVVVGGGGGGRVATQMRFFDIFPRGWNISNWRLQKLFVYPSRAF